jgi:hypothetical protein
MLDLFFQGENVGGCGAAAIDDRERVPGGNVNAASRVPGPSLGKLLQTARLMTGNAPVRIRWAWATSFRIRHKN